MKIAIPSRNNMVDDHFGHCEYFTLYTSNEENKIINEEIAPSGCGCKSNIIPTLSAKGVTIMLAGNMGQGAVNKITSAGIKVYRGCSGHVKTVVESFLSQEIVDSGSTCQQHSNPGHQCNH